jgi:uncharacterized membrane protein YeiH
VKNPYLLVLVCAAALATILLAPVMHRLRWPFLLLDALGLVVFTIVGCNIAIDLGMHPIVVIVAGMITGIVGGIMRDVLCNDVPLIFAGELYATVSIAAGCLYYGGLALGLPHDVVSIVAICAGFAFRVAAIVFGWQMPRFVYDKDLR